MSASLRGSAAAAYLGHADARTLFKLPIPRSNVAPEGSKKQIWVWETDELDKFLIDRRARPGYEGLD